MAEKRLFPENLQTFVEDGGQIIGVDVESQHDFATPGAPMHTEVGPVIRENLAKLSRSIKSRVGSVDSHSWDTAEFQSNGGLWPEHCVKGEKGWMRIDETRVGKTRFIPMSDGNIVVGEDVVGGGNRKFGKEDFAEEVLNGNIHGIFEKDAYSVFTNPKSKPYLRQLVETAGGIEKVLFAAYGYAVGGYCVDDWVKGLKNEGYNVGIVDEKITTKSN